MGLKERYLDIFVSGCAEFVGMTMFVFLGVGTATSSSAQVLDFPATSLPPSRIVQIACAFGFGLTACIYAIVNISSAHLNPAITFALMITHNCGLVRGLWYIVCQLVGAILGSALVFGCVGSPLNDGPLGTNGLAPFISAGEGVLTEAVGTFVLVFTVLQVAYLGSDPMSRGYNMGKFAPLAIGLAVLAVHLWSISLTGTGINPARSFGPAVVSGNWEDHWVFWVGPLIGSLFAVIFYVLLTAPFKYLGLHNRRIEKEKDPKPSWFFDKDLELESIEE